MTSFTKEDLLIPCCKRRNQLVLNPIHFHEVSASGSIKQTLLSCPEDSLKPQSLIYSYKYPSEVSTMKIKNKRGTPKFLFTQQWGKFHLPFSGSFAILCLTTGCREGQQRLFWIWGNIWKRENHFNSTARLMTKGGLYCIPYYGWTLFKCNLTHFGWVHLVSWSHFYLTAVWSSLAPQLSLDWRPGRPRPECHQTRFLPWCLRWGSSVPLGVLYGLS